MRWKGTLTCNGTCHLLRESPRTIPIGNITPHTKDCSNMCIHRMLSIGAAVSSSVSSSWWPCASTFTVKRTTKLVRRRICMNVDRVWAEGPLCEDGGNGNGTLARSDETDNGRMTKPASVCSVRRRLQNLDKFKRVNTYANFHASPLLKSISSPSPTRVTAQTLSRKAGFKYLSTPTEGSLYSPTPNYTHATDTDATASHRSKGWKA